MSMTKRTLVGFLVLLLLLAAMPAALAGGDQERPFKQDLQGYVVGMGADAGCTEGALWRTSMEGTGTVTHMGRVTWEASHCFHPNGTFSDSAITITAANGDQLFGEYTGAMTGATTWMEIDSFFGGTGRFEGATGLAHGTGWVDMDSGYMEITSKGWITYSPGH